MSPTGIHLDEGASGPPPRVPRLTRACQVPSPQFIFYLLRFYLFTTPPLSKGSYLFIILHVMLRATKARAQWVRMGVLQKVLIPETSIGCRNTQTETHTVYPSWCMVQFSTKDIRRGHVLVDDVH